MSHSTSNPAFGIHFFSSSPSPPPLACPPPVSLTTSTKLFLPHGPLATGAEEGDEDEDAVAAGDVPPGIGGTAFFPLLSAKASTEVGLLLPSCGTKNQGMKHARTGKYWRGTRA